MNSFDESLGAPLPAMIRPIPGGARGFLLSRLVDVTQKSWMVVAPDDNQARACWNDIRFFSRLPENRLVFMPDNEALPYDTEPASSALIQERAKALRHADDWRAGEPAIMVTTSSAILQRMADRSHWLDSAVVLFIGEKYIRADIEERLQGLGYRHLPSADEPASFASHPQVMDIYATGDNTACRLRFKGNTLLAIDQVDLETQRSTGPIPSKKLRCPPAREIPTTDAAKQRFTDRWRARYGAALTNKTFKKLTYDFQNAALEPYLPLLVERTVTLFDWLPQDAGVYWLPDACENAGRARGRAVRRYEELKATGADPEPLHPDELWLKGDEILSRVTGGNNMKEDDQGVDVGLVKTGLFRQPTLNDAIEQLKPWFSSDKRLLICAQTEEQRESLIVVSEMMGRPIAELEHPEDFSNSDHHTAIVSGSPSEGFSSNEAGFAVITEAEILGRPIRQKEFDSPTSPVATMEALNDFSSLRTGDPLVHILRGVGRFGGLEVLDYGAQPEMLLAIVYADRAKAFVKMEDLDLVVRYQSFDPDNAPLDAIDGNRWLPALAKSIKHAQEAAQHLESIHQARMRREGLACEPPGYAYEQFCQLLPFRETRGQAEAIADIIKDLVSSRPMDRIVSGDVGFGKTEVAMRAAFIAANSGYQVAVLVPTTVLAEQHCVTFSKRFEQTGFRVGLLCRGKPEGPVLQQLKDGMIDMVIGTHRLLNEDVKIPRLGLVIIDEEHRFGVKDKENLALIREQTNVLSLTATPIPRTLSMALQGVRDISVISTPPSRRLSIRTLVKPYSGQEVELAIEREMARGGQAFYLYNSVSGIQKRVQDLRGMMPDVRFGVVHGQMPALELGEVMASFYRHEFDVLVCTTIIETGIDVPNANTILIEGADRLGLAQLHQLRGRVGRSHRQAFCYLFRSDSITEDGQQRLLAMERASQLGAGLVLAYHDLEIRGAGEVLGKDQAGNIHDIGFQLYLEILQRAITASREGRTLDAHLPSPNGGFFDLPYHGMLTPDYIKSPSMRLSMLSKLARTQHPDEAKAIQREMEDRFGPLNKEARNLIVMSAIRFPLRKLGIRKLKMNVEGVYRFFLSPGSPAAHSAFNELAEKRPDRVRIVDQHTYETRPKTWGTSIGLMNSVARLVDRIRDHEGRDRQNG